MRSGTTTMKMISSTSTTSTSGVRLISDCRPDPEALLLSSMTSLSPRPCDRALADQPHPAEAGLLDCEHDLPDLEEVQLCVPPPHALVVRLRAHVRSHGF